jgi:hypothetical protein
VKAPAVEESITEPPPVDMPIAETPLIETPVVETPFEESDVENAPRLRNNEEILLKGNKDIQKDIQKIAILNLYQPVLYCGKLT